MTYLEKVLTLVILMSKCTNTMNCDDCCHCDENGCCMVRVFFLNIVPCYTSISNIIEATKPGAVPDDLWEGLKEGYYGDVFEERKETND